MVTWWIWYGLVSISNIIVEMFILIMVMNCYNFVFVRNNIVSVVINNIIIVLRFGCVSSNIVNIRIMFIGFRKLCRLLCILLFLCIR